MVVVGSPPPPSPAPQPTAMTSARAGAVRRAARNVSRMNHEIGRGAPIFPWRGASGRVSPITPELGRRAASLTWRAASGRGAKRLRGCRVGREERLDRELL